MFPRNHYKQRNITLGNIEKCADSAIQDFVKKLAPPYYPNWAGLIPGDIPNGWGASRPSWRKQADSIMNAFEECIGFKIRRNYTEVEMLRNETLSTFRHYLIENAILSEAKISLEKAKNRLKNVKSSITTFKVR